MGEDNLINIYMLASYKFARPQVFFGEVLSRSPNNSLVKTCHPPGRYLQQQKTYVSTVKERRADGSGWWGERVYAADRQLRTRPRNAIARLGKRAPAANAMHHPPPTTANATLHIYSAARASTFARRQRTLGRTSCRRRGATFLDLPGAIPICSTTPNAAAV